MDDRELVAYERDDLHREVARLQGNRLLQTQAWDVLDRLSEQILARIGTVASGQNATVMGTSWFQPCGGYGQAAGVRAHEGARHGLHVLAVDFADSISATPQDIPGSAVRNSPCVAFRPSPLCASSNARRGMRTSAAPPPSCASPTAR